jgi:hypothetical protein
MDRILVDGDQAMFQPSFGAAAVVVQPGHIRGTGKATLNGKPLCIEGDEGSVSVPGCNYQTPQYSIPGVGTLEIAALGGDQKGQKTRTGSKPVLLVGGSFTARFKVSAPAQQPQPAPAPPTPDLLTEYSGSGTFVSANAKLRGT